MFQTNSRRIVPFNSRGQSMADLVLGTFVFILVLSAVISFYYSALNSSNSLGNEISMREKAFVAASKLFESQGYPKNWNELDLTDINSIGLLDFEQKASEEKIVSFINSGNTDYGETKEKLGMPEYDFYFTFIQAPEVNLASGLEIAPSIDSDAIVIRRIVPFRGGEAIAELTVYQA